MTSSASLVRGAQAPTRAVALVTGASSGIGLEMARLLAAERRSLLLVSRDQGKLDGIAQALVAEHGVSVDVLAIDLAEPGAASRVAAFATQRGLQVDLLINNAGIGIYGEHTELDRAQLDGMLQLNIRALTELCLLFGAQMKQRGSGRILNIASTAAYQPTPFMAAYGASKAYVLNFSEALAMELRDDGVTVSCLSPGPTDTAFFGAIDQKGPAPNDHFRKEVRDTAREVAAIGLETVRSGKLSHIVGVKNYLRAWSGRLVSRAMVANFAKGVMAD